MVIELGAVAEREVDDVLRWSAGVPLLTLTAQRAQIAQTLATLPETERVLALPAAKLYAISDDVASLPDDVQAKVRALRAS